MGTRHAMLNAVATGKGREVEVLGNKKLRTSLRKKCQHGGGVGPVTTTITSISAKKKMKGETTTPEASRDGRIFRKGVNVPVRILEISIHKGLIIADAVDDHHHPKKERQKKR